MGAFKLPRKYQAILLGVAILIGAAAFSWWWPLSHARFIDAGPAVGLLLLAFASGYVDTSLGMGYGVTLTPVLLLLGYRPLEVVPAVVASQLVLGMVGAFAHHAIGNVDFRPGTRAFWITATLVAASVLATVGAAEVAVRLRAQVLEAWIGIVVLGVGVATLATFGRHLKFSWWKIFVLGGLAGFNKGSTGGGYGPVVTGGQILFGVSAANAVSITTLAETLACIAGSLTYFFGSGIIDWTLTPFLTVGAVAAVPFSALTVRVLKPLQLKISVGVLTSALGLLLLLKMFAF
jgi:uncharacterized membrane protein YfcA